jgi:hypothetical protein
MKKSIFLKGLSLFLVLEFMSCVHARTDRDLDRRLQTDTEAPSEKELEAKSIDWINTVPRLTDRERERLSELRIQTTLHLRDLNQKSRQLRRLLMESLADSNETAEELSAIKRRIKKNDTEKIVVILQAIDKASSILRRTKQTPPELMEEFWFDHQNIY